MLKAQMSVFLLLSMGQALAAEQYAPAPDTQFDKTPCVVLGAEGTRSGLYAPNEKSDELIELEMAACRVMAGIDEYTGGSLLHEHAMTHVDGGPTLHGADAGNAYFAGFNKEGGDFLTFQVVEAHISASGDMGWTHGLYKFQPLGGQLEVGKFVSVWHREESGWKIVSEMRNPF